MIAPWIGSLSTLHPYIPVMVFRCVALLAGVAALWLPETVGRPLPYTIQESEDLTIKSIAIPTILKGRRKTECRL